MCQYQKNFVEITYAKNHQFANVILEKNITDIEFDLKSRDKISKLLIGLQYIYSESKIREQVFNILRRIVPQKSRETGRPGMDFWKILVLATLRLNCNWDFDKVHDIANNHFRVRQMLVLDSALLCLKKSDYSKQLYFFSVYSAQLNKSPYYDIAIIFIAFEIVFLR